MAGKKEKTNRYEKLIEAVFFDHYKKGARKFTFRREELVKHASNLGIGIPKNLGDLIYSFRYRAKLPKKIAATAPRGHQWIIAPAGTGVYRFVAWKGDVEITPSSLLLPTKIPDATPGVIARYALSDEQALLARLRYNRLIDIFTRVSCYSLQNHLRTSIRGMGQVETDEVYVGIDKRGVHFVFPVQAKGGSDRLNIVQIMQDVAMCGYKFPMLICRPIAAQFIDNSTIALFEFRDRDGDLGLISEKHYRLAPSEEVSEEDLRDYQSEPDETE